MTQPNEPAAPATRVPDEGRWVDAGWDDADEGAVLPGERVQQAGLPDVRPADERDATRAARDAEPLRRRLRQRVEH